MNHPGRSRLAPGAALAVLLLASAWGLLCTRISDYDDSILLVGARLVRAGALPYRDFYAHYGPFGFSLQAVLTGLFRSPPLALRLGQSACLALLAVCAFAGARRAGTGRPASAAWTAVLFALALSAAALLPSFYGFAFTLAALGAFARGAFASAADDAPRPGALTRWAAASGALLAAAALIRPAFALYALAAIAITGIALGPPGRRGRILLSLAAAFALAGLLLWALLYRPLSPARIFEATVLFPRRLLEGGRRYGQAAFLTAPLPLAFVFTCLLAAIPLAWTAALRSRRGRALAGAGILAIGALPLWLRVSARPQRDAVLVSAGAVAIVSLLMLLQRADLRRDAALCAAALFGLAAAAFEHYIWARADRPHFLPFLVTGAAGAALCSRALSARGRWALLAASLALFAFFAGFPGAIVAPAEAIWRGGAAETARLARAPRASWRSVWPCSEVPEDAVRAAAAADRAADPASRFVAAASSQAFADQNPVLLFLLSARLPYTGWYQYDPGVQNAEPAQSEMIRELERSGSRSAVVWFAEVYTAAGERPLVRTPFDEAFDRLYPVRGPRFGLYELRFRADAQAETGP